MTSDGLGIIRFSENLEGLEADDGGAAAGGLDQVEFAEFFQTSNESGARHTREGGEFFLEEREVNGGIEWGGRGALVG